jgi:type IV secretion system protein TrbL
MRAALAARRHTAAVVLAALLAAVAALVASPVQSARAADIGVQWNWPNINFSINWGSPDPAPPAAPPLPPLRHLLPPPPAPVAPPPAPATDPMAPTAAPMTAPAAAPAPLRRSPAYAPHGALDHVDKFLVDGVVTALGWLRQSLLSPSLEPNWRVVNPAYSEMTMLALGLVIAFVALALLEHMAGGVRGAGPSVLSRLIAAVMVAMAGLPLIAWFVQGIDAIAGLWTSSMGSAITLVLDRMTSMLQSHTGSGVPEAAAIAILALFALLTTLLVVAWLVLRLVLVQALVVFLPLVAVMAIYPRTGGAARRMGEYLASLVLTKLAMVIFMSVGFQILAFGLQGVPDWLAITSATVLLGMVAFTPWALLRGVHLAEMETMGVVRRRSGHGSPLGGVSAAGDAAAGTVAWGLAQMHRRDAEEVTSRPRPARAARPATYLPMPGRNRPAEAAAPRRQEVPAAQPRLAPPTGVTRTIPEAPSASPPVAVPLPLPSAEPPRVPAPPSLRPRIQGG